MAGSGSTYLRTKLIDHSLGTTTYTKPASVWLAAYVGDPGGAGVECSGTSYARVQIEFDSATQGATDNANDETFPVAGGSWGTITHMALYDAETVGNMLWYGPMTDSKAIESGDQLKVSAGNFDVTLT